MITWLIFLNFILHLATGQIVNVSNSTFATCGPTRLARSSKVIHHGDLDIHERKEIERIMKERKKFDKVTLQVFYEAFCPDSREFITNEFLNVVQKLAPYLNVYMFPYGKAKTLCTMGRLRFECSRGQQECYGNKIHACALDHIHNTTRAAMFVACLMESSHKDRGSDDTALEVCAKCMGVKARLIRGCARKEKGSNLLNYCGDMTKKEKFTCLPYVRVNKRTCHGRHLFKLVCREFKRVPPPCRSILNNLQA